MMPITRSQLISASHNTQRSFRIQLPRYDDYPIWYGSEGHGWLSWWCQAAKRFNRNNHNATWSTDSVSGWSCCSRKAENSVSRRRGPAMLRPCHAGCISCCRTVTSGLVSGCGIFPAYTDGGGRPYIGLMLPSQNKYQMSHCENF